MTLAVRTATEAVYPEAVAMLTDAGHQVHEVSRNLPAFPVLGPANSNSRVLIGGCRLAWATNRPGTANRLLCVQYSSSRRCPRIAVAENSRILLGVAGECIEVVPEPGQVRLRVHDIDSSWTGVSGEGVSTLRQLLQGCRSGSVDQSAIVPFQFKGSCGPRMAMIRAAGLAWLAAHELAHTSEKIA